MSCELLSFSYLWNIRNSPIILFYSHLWLWIAFIFISLKHQKQSKDNKQEQTISCELLSFSYLWNIRNSTLSNADAKQLLWIAFIFISLKHQKQFMETKIMTQEVVNCFHFHIFETSETVKWFCNLFCHSCELLSFSYLWNIRNS